MHKLNTGNIDRNIFYFLTSMLTVFSSAASSAPATFDGSNVISINSPAPYFAGASIEPFLDTAIYDASAVPNSVTDTSTYNWGDGSTTTETTALGLGGVTKPFTENLPLVSHVYSEPGTYNVIITDVMSVIIGPDIGSSTNTIDESLVISPSVTAVPLPSALPLFVSFVGVFGLFSRRRKRRNLVPM